MQSGYVPGGRQLRRRTLAIAAEAICVTPVLTYMQSMPPLSISGSIRAARKAAASFPFTATKSVRTDSPGLISVAACVKPAMRRFAAVVPKLSSESNARTFRIPDSRAPSS